MFEFCIILISHIFHKFACRQPVSDRSLITRHDSTLSAMRCLLEGSSQESTESQEASQVSTESQEASQVSTVSQEASQEMPTPQDAAAETPATPAAETPATPAAETPATPASASTVSSDSQETATPETPQEEPEEDGFINHHIYAAAELRLNKKLRLSLRTRSPRLWRHGCKLYGSFCAYSGKS